jgi:S-DNA-T family DNA segregation ATPase FtsK/SpoIIIE
MSVPLSVRDVRDALHRHAAPGDGEPSCALLGSLFHETFAALLEAPGDGEPADARDDRALGREELLQKAFRDVVGPRLRRDRALLQPLASQVLSFWAGVESLCEWLAELGDVAPVASTEEPLTCVLRAPDWTDSVRLTGVADAILRDPRSGRWCVVELKLGRTTPEADLAQAVLYHLIATESARAGGSVGEGQGTVALVTFGPERKERLFSAGEIESARLALFDLIGKLAGVLSSEPATVSVSNPITTADSSRKPTPEHRQLGERLIEVLAEYGVNVEPEGEPVVGPAFIRFPVALGTGVRVAAVERHAPEIRVRLGLKAPPRIRLDGARVVVDIQRPDRQVVPFASIRDDLDRGNSVEGSSRLPVGVRLDGQLTTADLSLPENAHLLVAGTTGSGKSEWLRTALAGLIVANTPDTLRLVLIDPKRNAFTWLRNSPYLLYPIVYPGDSPVAEVLAGLAEEMERRYRLMGTSDSDTIVDHVRRTSTAVPRIVCVVDEYADLVRGDREERRRIEEQVTRLGSKARAAGIHLILATQQPSREVIKGALDANIPARIGLRMERPIESRMLLNQSGAETLLGHGDLLFKDIGEPVRLQAVLLGADDRASLGRAEASHTRTGPKPEVTTAGPVT